MKKIITIVFAIISLNVFGQIGQKPSKFNYGIQLPNAVNDTIADSIPVMDGNGVMNGWLTKSQLNIPDISGKLNISDTSSMLMPYARQQSLKDTALAIRADLQRNYINIKDYGAAGDGVTDDTQEFLNAKEAAISQSKALYIPTGDYVLTGDSTIDMSGLTALFGDGNSSVLNCEGYAEILPDGWVFGWMGDTTRVSNMMSITEGDFEITINTGLDLANGDILFQVSAENLPNYIENGSKSQRLTVREYNPTTGVVAIYEGLEWSTDSAIFWHNSRAEEVILSDFKMITDTNKVLKGIQITNGIATINNVEIVNFGRMCLVISNSRAVINNYRSVVTETPASSAQYGIQVADLSEVDLYGCKLIGGRHAFQIGGTGYWNDAMFGKPSNPLFASPNARVFGGVFSAQQNAGAFDQHGNGNELIVTGATINGGIQVGGKTAIFDGCYINANSLFNISINRDNDIGVPYGDVVFNNCFINTSNAYILRTGGGVQNKLTFNNVYFSGKFDSNIDAVLFPGINRMGSVDFINCTQRTTGPGEVTWNMSFYGEIDINDFDLRRSSIVYLAQNGSGSFTANRLKIDTTSAANALIISGALIGSAKITNSEFRYGASIGINSILPDSLEISNTIITGFPSYALRVRNNTHLKLLNNNLNGGTITQGGIRYEPVTGSEYYLVGNDIRNNIDAFNILTGSPTRLAQFGNLADVTIPDYVRNSSGNLVVADIPSPTDISNWNISYNNMITTSVYDTVTDILTLTQQDGGELTAYIPQGSGGGGGSADGVTTAGSYDAVNEEIDYTVQAPGVNYSVDVSGILQAALDLARANIDTSGTQTLATISGTSDDITEGTTNLFFTTLEETKLSGIEAGATANSSDAVLLNRANHTGTQGIATITNLQDSIVWLRERLIMDIVEVTTDRNMADTDVWKRLRNSTASTVTITITSELNMNVGDRIIVQQFGTGVMGIRADVDVTINGVLNGQVDLPSQYSSRVLEKIGTDNYVISIN